jgi:hypothetical protein
MPPVACPHCGGVIANDGTLGGQVVRCPLCGGQFLMPVAVKQPITAAGPPSAGPSVAYAPPPHTAPTAGHAPPQRPVGGHPSSPTPRAAHGAPAPRPAGPARSAHPAPAPAAALHVDSVAEQYHQHQRSRGTKSAAPAVISVVAMLALAGIAILLIAHWSTTAGHNSPAYRQGYHLGMEGGETARKLGWRYNPRPDAAMLQRVKNVPPAGTPEYGYFLDGYRAGYDKVYYGR